MRENTPWKWEDALRSANVPAKFRSREKGLKDTPMGHLADRETIRAFVYAEEEPIPLVLSGGAEAEDVLFLLTRAMVCSGIPAKAVGLPSLSEILAETGYRKTLKSVTALDALAIPGFYEEDQPPPPDAPTLSRIITTAILEGVKVILHADYGILPSAKDRGGAVVESTVIHKLPLGAEWWPYTLRSRLNRDAEKIHIT